jgi:hypothetical protein
MPNNQLFEDIGYIKAKVEKIDSMDCRLEKIEKQVNWIYAYAAGVAMVFSIMFAYIKDKIKNLL